jgi:sugar lactone lactonase YvrE
MVLAICFLGEHPLLLAQSYYPTPYAFTTLAGSTGNIGGGDGTGSTARFSFPSGVAVDGSGNLYVADTYNDTIRKITPAGVVTILAGSAGQQGSNDGMGSNARFYLPSGVAVDRSGNVYVADNGNDTIRKITPGGVVTTLAGSAGQGGSSDGRGSEARFNAPSDVAVDGKGNLYVTDIYDRTIRKITPGGVVTTTFDSKHLHNKRTSGGVVMTLAGSAGQGGSSDGTGSAARFSYPSGAAVDASGNLYVADTYNDTIRKITPGGAVTTLAGSAGQAGSSDGTGSDARFFLPHGMAVDGSGNVYVADTYNDTIRKITPGGVVTTLVGSAGLFGTCFRVAVDGSGNVYVEDNFNDTARNHNFNIRKITPGGVVTTLAGGTGQAGSSDGTGNAARFNEPSGVAVDGSGNVYVAEEGSNTISKITTGGVVTTLAGSAGQRGSSDGTGSAACFNAPSGVVVDSSGNLYVTDRFNNTIRKITPGGVVTTLAGCAGQEGSIDGTGSSARFNNPGGVAVDGSGNVYVADMATIRKITPGGVVTTFAGSAGQQGSSDGTGSAARFKYPSGVAVDASGNVYVADSGNDTIRKITPGGVVTTFAGSEGQQGSSNGMGSDARFVIPTCVAVDGSGNVYVADMATIRKITPSGVVTTMAGSPPRSKYPSKYPSLAVDGKGNVYVGDFYSYTINKITPDGVVTILAGCAGQQGSSEGTDSAAPTHTPYNVAVDRSGNIYVAETNNYTISKITPGGVVTTLAGSAGQQGSSDGTGSDARFNAPSDVAVDGRGNVYVVDAGIHDRTIRKITPGGVVTTLAGTEGQLGSESGWTVDDSGNVYVAGNVGDTIRKITPGGVVTIFAGSAGQAGNSDGTGSDARFNNPNGVAVDGGGNVYVADSDNDTIRKITPVGVVSTFAGSAGQEGSSDGTGSDARFCKPYGVAVDGSGNVYVADTYNYTIRKITPGGVVTTLAGIAQHSGDFRRFPSKYNQ